MWYRQGIAHRDILGLISFALLLGTPWRSFAAEPAAPAPGAMDQAAVDAIQVSVLTRLCIVGYAALGWDHPRSVLFSVSLTDDQVARLRSRVHAAGFYEFIFRRREDATDLFAGIGKVGKKSGHADQTNKPAMVLKVEVKNISGDRASGHADYYVGPLFAKGYVFECERRDGQWFLIRFRPAWVS